MVQGNPEIRNEPLAVKLSSVSRGILGLALHILRSKWRCLLDSYEPYPHSVQRLVATRPHEVTNTPFVGFVGRDLGLLLRYGEIEAEVKHELRSLSRNFFFCFTGRN